MARIAARESVVHYTGQDCPQNVTKVQDSQVKKVKKNRNGTSTFIITSRYIVDGLRDWKRDTQRGNTILPLAAIKTCAFAKTTAHYLSFRPMSC